MTIILTTDGHQVRIETLDDLKRESPASLGITQEQYTRLTEILSESVC